MAKKVKMLIIDDIKMITDLLRHEFEKDFEVFTATSGTSGLELAECVLPDVILLDIMMPDITGVEVTRHLAAHLETSGIPVVAITTAPTSETLAHLEACPNYRGYVSKMDPSKKIREVIHKALRE